MLISRNTHIYGLVCPRSGEIRYVGKSNDPWVRLNSHLSNRQSRTPKVCWISSLVKDGLRPTVKILETVSVNDWEEAERWWIKNLRSQGAQLLNCLDGGEGWQSGRPHSEETKRKIREGNLGKVSSEYQKTKAREGRLGYKKPGASSMYIGVNWFKARNRWHASIVDQCGKRISLGYHVEETKAAQSYNQAALSIYKSDAILNNIGETV